MSVGIRSRTPHLGHPDNRAYSRAWRLAKALPVPGQPPALHPVLGALGVALLVTAMAAPWVGVLLEVLAYLSWVDTGRYTVPLVRTAFPALPALLSDVRAGAAGMALSVAAAALLAGYAWILAAVHTR